MNQKSRGSELQAASLLFVTPKHTAQWTGRPEICSTNLAAVGHLHVCLLTAAGTPCTFPVTEHAAHALHLRWRQILVQLGLPRTLMLLLLIPKAVPSAAQLVQLWDCASVIISRRVLLRVCAATGLLSQPPVVPNLVSATTALAPFWSSTQPTIHAQYMLEKPFA